MGKMWLRCGDTGTCPQADENDPLTTEIDDADERKGKI